jgi:hypothetical protein
MIGYGGKYQMKSVIDAKLRTNHTVRLLLLPFVRIKRQFDYYDYHKRVNTDYLGKIKGSKKRERCFIVGNGPSLTPEDLDMIKGEFSFGSNRIYDIYEKTTWRPNYYIVVDKSVIKGFKKGSVLNLGVDKFFVFDKELADYFGGKNDVQEIFLKGKTPISREKYYQKSISENLEDYFTTTQSVTCNALELAFYMGFSEIYLLGVDHNYQIERDINGKMKVNQNIQSHFKETKDKDFDKVAFNKEAATKCYETCKKYADSHDIKIYNCTRGGKLEVFERKKLEDVICAR